MTECARSSISGHTGSSAMVREPNTIHTAADESSSSTTHLVSSASEQQDTIMPDIDIDTKLRNSRTNNRATPGELRHKHTGHSSGDEETHDDEDKHDDNEEVRRFITVLLGKLTLIFGVIWNSKMVIWKFKTR